MSARRNHVILEFGNVTDAQAQALAEIRALFGDPDHASLLNKWLAGEVDLWLDQDSGQIRGTSARRDQEQRTAWSIARLQTPVNRN